VRASTAFLSFFDVIDRPAYVVRRSFRTLYPVALAGSLASAVLGSLYQLALLGGADVDPGSMPAVMGLAYLVGLVGMIVYAVTMLAVFDGMRRVFDGESAGTFRCYREALRFRALMSLLLPGLALVVGWLLCCLPGIVVWVLIAFVPAIIVDERPFPTEVPVRSSDLVRRGSTAGFRPVLGVLVVGLLVTYAIQSIHSLPAAVVVWISSFSRLSSGEAIDPQQMQAEFAWINIVTTFVAAFIVPIGHLYVSAAVTTLFRQARERRDGAQLEEALQERLGRGESPAPGGP
jgi:hypothetical protein